MRVTSKVLKSLFRQCIEDRCPQIAASLAYTTLLALIPLTVVIYKIFTTALIAPDLQLKVQQFVFKSLSPTTAEQVRQFLFNSAVHAGNINIVGLTMLFVSVVIMMYTIDSAINMIWKIHKPRYMLRRLVVYVSILVLGPLAISFSMFISTYLASLPLVTEVVDISQEKGYVYHLPFFITWIAFTLLYKWVPDCEVRLLHAFAGGTIAACLFEIAKSGFTLYVSYFPTYELLYGALASIPLLLIWIYLTWLIVLIGAEITHFMQK